MVYTMRTNSLLTPCKQGAVLSRYSISLFHEHELRTHAANLEQARCGTFLTSAFRYLSVQFSIGFRLYPCSFLPKTT